MARVVEQVIYWSQGWQFLLSTCQCVLWQDIEPRLQSLGMHKPVHTWLPVPCLKSLRQIKYGNAKSNTWIPWHTGLGEAWFASEMEKDDLLWWPLKEAVEGRRRLLIETNLKALLVHQYMCCSLHCFNWKLFNRRENLCLRNTVWHVFTEGFTCAYV